eukprot:1177253-Prorocentrum_minimum.AAC.1
MGPELSQIDKTRDFQRRAYRCGETGRLCGRHGGGVVPVGLTRGLHFWHLPLHLLLHLHLLLRLTLTFLIQFATARQMHLRGQGRGKGFKEYQEGGRWRQKGAALGSWGKRMYIVSWMRRSAMLLHVHLNVCPQLLGLGGDALQHASHHR